jgi:hypothetical protein
MSNPFSWSPGIMDEQEMHRGEDGYRVYTGHDQLHPDGTRSTVWTPVGRQPDIFEYECPVRGIDFDIEPPPAYGSTICCSACGGTHVADEHLGTVLRDIGDDMLDDITDGWKAAAAREIVRD